MKSDGGRLRREEESIPENRSSNKMETKEDFFLDKIDRRLSQGNIEKLIIN